VLLLAWSRAAEWLSYGLPRPRRVLPAGVVRICRSADLCSSPPKTLSSIARARTIPPTHNATNTRACSRASGPFRFTSNSRIIDYGDLPLGALDRLAAARGIRRELDRGTTAVELGDRDQRLSPHRNPRPAHLGRPGLGAAGRVGTRPHADPWRRDDDARGRRAFPSARPPARADRGNRALCRAQSYSSLEAVSAVAAGCGFEMMYAATSQACCRLSTGSW